MKQHVPGQVLFNCYGSEIGLAAIKSSSSQMVSQVQGPIVIMTFSARDLTPFTTPNRGFVCTKTDVYRFPRLH